MSSKNRGAKWTPAVRKRAKEQKKKQMGARLFCWEYNAVNLFFSYSLIRGVAITVGQNLLAKCPPLNFISRKLKVNFYYLR